MKLNDKVLLGTTGLKVGRIGISSSYGANAEVFEEAFDYGCNYFTVGTFIKGDSREMKKAIKNLVSGGKRNEMVISVFSYAHHPFFTRFFLKRLLKSLGLDHIDILLLGYFNKIPSSMILQGARRLKAEGLINHIGISSHNRRLFKELLQIPEIDVLHVRYNAAHRGAEEDVFPFFNQNDRPGIVSFTATRWEKLLNSKNLPASVQPLSAADCYRFVLSNPSVDVCMMGVRNVHQLRENMAILEMGTMDEAELKRARTVGDFVYKR
jgi:aryl-alcohol dehydrogenase-like predicted oxidoreductase